MSGLTFISDASAYLGIIDGSRPG